MEELEIMRKQLADMKQRLDTQQIVNKELLYRLMRRKASWLNKFVNIEILLLPLIYLVFVMICSCYGISQWYSFVYLLLTVCDVVLDWRTVRIPARMFCEASIIQLRKFLIRQKKERFVHFIIAAPLAVIWVIAFIIALYLKTEMTVSGDFLNAFKTGGIIGGIVGLVIGSVCGVVVFKRMQRTNDSLLNDIADLESDN